MQLVVFTAHYPYGHGEEFLENELCVAEEYFERITIVSMEKSDFGKVRYVPRNATVVPVRQNTERILQMLYGLCGLLRIRVWKEFFYARRNTAYSSAAILRQLMIQEMVMAFVRRNEQRWVKNRFDTVYYSYWLGTNFAFKGGRLQGLKISRAHGGDCFFDREYHPYRREALRNLDYVFPISEAGREDIIAHYKDAVQGLEEKVKTARLGIAIPEMLNQYNRTDERTIVTCSNIIQLKRLDLLIDALSEITDMNIRWIHFGEGVLRKDMEQYAEKKLGRKKNIHYEFRGYTPNHELLSFYENASIDLFVNCSDVEGISVSVMEAMAHGIPAIGRNVGGMGELIHDTCGRLLPAQTSPQALADAIQAILGLPAEAYLALRANARETVKENYDVEKNYHRLFGFLKERISCRDAI